MEKEIKSGLFYDDEGNFSSGRVVKMQSIVLAAISFLTGIIVLIKDPSNLAISDYCFKTTGLFVATASAAEIVQKTTGR